MSRHSLNSDQFAEALVVHELTKHALDETFPPAQRMKALELLGKITEVALFTERREVVSVSNPAEIKEKLMASLRLAMGSDIVDVEATDGADLLAEIEQGKQAQADDADAEDAEPQAEDDPGQGDPTTTPPPESGTERR